VNRSRIRVRAAHSEDREFIERLGKRTVMDSVPVARRPDPVSVLANYDRLLAIVWSQSHIALIAEENGARAGFLLMLDGMPDEVTGENQGFVAYMAVEAQSRGKGIGRALLSAAEDEARKHGLPYISLMVTEDNAAARALYERAGYATERRLLCKPL
jgi:ribosomal protein S18 acetylase RimI-like enzyme